MKAILLLHGAAFSSETWESVGTLEMLNELGVSTVTIDLPSYHNSAKVTIPKNKIEYLSFIREQFEILNFKKIFIISPSMSGKVCKPKFRSIWLKKRIINKEMSHLIPIYSVIFNHQK